MDTTASKNLIFKTTRVLLILFLAYFFRVVMVDNTILPTPIRNDAREYYSYALNMKFNNTYSRNFPKSVVDPAYTPKPDKVRPPGYSLFLYPFVKFPPDMDMVHQVQFAQVIIDTFTVLVAFGFFKLFLSYRLALFTSFLVAISPHLIAMNIYILTEPYLLLRLLCICTLRQGVCKKAVWVIFF